jgi:predicted nucleotidyltransferase
MLKSFYIKNPKLNKAITAFAKGVLQILEDNLIGVYLFGSLTYDDFNPKRSDIDFMVIVKKPVNIKNAAELKKFHLDLEKRFPEWKKRVEASYTPLEMLKNIYPPDKPRPYFGEGRFYQEADYGNEWLINLYLLEKHGISLTGPDFPTLIKPINICQVSQSCEQ